jgi:hypothetical protein
VRERDETHPDYLICCYVCVYHERDRAEGADRGALLRAQEAVLAQVRA